ncbi:hypothetical protein [Blastococcus sp. SYSU D00820]
MLTEQRREQFTTEVEQVKLKGDQSKGDARARITGIVFMVVGVIGAFLCYNASLNMDDLRDVGSYQTLAVAMTALTVAGAALYLAGAVAKVLRLWLLRQLMDNQTQTDRIAAALADRRL